MTGFRHRADVGFERRCPFCTDWWPITLDFWDGKWTTRCRACINEWKRVNQNARYRDDPDFRETKKEAARLSAWKDRQNKPGTIRERKASYYQANRDRILESSRLRYHAKRDAA